MNTKFHLPIDPAERMAVWSEQLNRVEKAKKIVAMERIGIGQKVVALEARTLLGPEQRTERSALHKRELENRMKELCLLKQAAELKNAIQECICTTTS